jgi:hypothetical protein
MNEAAWQEQVSKRVWVLQMIVAALVAGCVFFLVIVLVSHGSAVGGAIGDGLTPLTWVALSFLALMAVSRAIVPAVIVRQGRRSIARGTFSLSQARQLPLQGDREEVEEMGDAGRLFVLYQTKTIIGAALIEGATFFIIIAYLVERNTVALGIAVALILAVAAHIPTRTGVVHWIEDQLRLVAEERSLGR